MSCRAARWPNTMDGGSAGSADRSVTAPRLCGRDRSIQNWKPGTGTSYHASGTCRMGAGDEGVVDAEARVKAVRGLRVIDTSIMPTVVTGNLNAPVIMMAEKISDRIRGVPPLVPVDAPYYRAGTLGSAPPRPGSSF